MRIGRIVLGTTDISSTFFVDTDQSQHIHKQNISKLQGGEILGKPNREGWGFKRQARVYENCDRDAFGKPIATASDDTSEGILFELFFLFLL
jgi:hypothetical protein